jgi:hypothetical protein
VFCALAAGGRLQRESPGSPGGLIGSLEVSFAACNCLHEIPAVHLRYWLKV